MPIMRRNEEPAMSAILKHDAATPARTPLAELEQHDAFCARHIGADAAEQAAMLSVLRYRTRAALTDAVVPAGIRKQSALALPPGRSEIAALAELKQIAAKNV